MVVTQRWLAPVRAAVQAVRPRFRCRAQRRRKASTAPRSFAKRATTTRRSRRSPPTGVVRLFPTPACATAPRAARRADRQSGHARVLGIGEATACRGVVGRHRCCVRTPEERARRARASARRTRRARSPRRYCGATRPSPRRVAIRASASGTRGRGRAPPTRSAGRAAGRRARRNGRSGARRPPAIAGDREAQQRERIERMLGGKLSGMPSFFACQTQKRYVNVRFAGISAGPFCPFASRRPRTAPAGSGSRCAGRARPSCSLCR